jgi:hypothetical protein
MEKILKTFIVSAPTSGTVVHTSAAPPGAAFSMPQPQRADFFFRRNPVSTPGSGNILKGNPKASQAKKKRK